MHDEWKGAKTLSEEIVIHLSSTTFEQQNSASFFFLTLGRDI